MEKKNLKTEKKTERKLKIPANEFNPRVKKVEIDDERFFAYESQKAHSH